MPRLQRLILLTLAGLAVLSASLYLSLTSDRFEGQIRDRLLVEFERGLGAPLALSSFEIEPVFLRLTVHDLALRIGDEGPAIQAERVTIRLNPLLLLGSRQVIDSIDLDRADVTLDLDHPIPFPAAAASGAPRPLPQHVRLQRSRLRVLHPRFAIDLTDLEADARLGRRSSVDADLAFSITAGDRRGRGLGSGRGNLDLGWTPGRGFDLRRLALVLAAGRIDASGTIAAGAEGVVDVGVEGEINLGPLVAGLGKDGAARGRLRYSGRAAGTRQAPRFRGRVASPAGIGSGPLVARNLGAELLIGGRGATLSSGSAEMFGGAARFRARLPFATTAAAEVTYQASELDLARVRETFPTAPVLAGRASAEGTLTVAYSGGVGLESATRFTAAEPALAFARSDPRWAALAAPLAGEAAVSYADGVVEVRQITLKSAWAEAKGEASFAIAGPTTGLLSIRLPDAGALARLEAVSIPGMGPTESYSLTGPATAALHWSGTRERPEMTIAGSILAPRLRRGEALAGTAVALPKVEFSGGYLDHRLYWQAESAGPPHLTASGETRFEGAPRHRFRASASRLAASALDLLGRPIPATGMLELRAVAERDGEDWTGTIAVALEGSLFGRPVENGRLDLGLAPAATTVSATIASGGAALELHGTIADGALDLALEARAVPIELLEAPARVGLGGTVSLMARISGTTAAPRGDGAVEVAAAAASGLSLGDLAGTFVLTPEQLAVDLGASEALALHLTLATTPPHAYQAEARFTRLALAPLVAAAAPALATELTGEASGTLGVAGELAGAGVTAAELAVSSVRADIAGLTFRADRPWTLTLQAQREALALRGLLLVGAESHLEVSGTIGLGETDSDVALVGRTDLRLLTAYLRDLAASGPVAIDMRLGGRRGALELFGQAELSDGYFRIPALPYPLREASARAVFAGRKAALSGRARFGGGSLSAEGEIELGTETGPRLVLGVQAEDVRFDLFPDLEVRADADLTYRTEGPAPLLSGSLAVTRAVYRPRSGLSGLSVLRRVDREEQGKVSGFGASELDLTVVAENNLWLISDEAKLEGDARLTIRGTVRDPEVLGSVHFLAQERLVVQGNRYRVQRGSLIFDNPFRLEPRLDFEATTRLPGYNIILRLSGPISAPHVEATSDPPLPSNDVLSLVVSGVAPPASSTGNAPIGADGQGTLRSLLLGSAVGSLSGGRVSVSPLALGGRADPTEVLPLTIRPAENFDFTVGLPLGGAGPSLVVFNWRPIGSLTLSLSRDLNRGYGAEATHERRFGGPPRPELASPLLVDVRLAGLESIAAADVAAVSRGLRARSGRRLDREALRLDVETLTTRLRDLGYPLARVEAAAAVAGDDLTATVTYSVTSGLQVSITLAGAGDERDLRSRLSETVQSFGIYGETLGELERSARKKLEEDGYARALVSCARPAVATSAVRIDCEVEPGQRYRLRAVDIAGNLALRDHELRPVLRAHAGRWRSKRLVTVDVEADLEALRRAYHGHGYLAATVRARQAVTPERNNITLTYIVVEGPRYTVSGVTLEGMRTVPEAAIRTGLGLRPGVSFTSAAMDRDRDHLHRIYSDSGHLATRIVTGWARDPDGPTVSVTYRVEEGEPARVGSLRIEGLRRTARETVIRELEIEPGGPLSYDRLTRSQRRLYDLGVFRSVEITPLPGEGGSDSEGGRRDVRIRVEEAAPYRLALGGGFDSESGVRGLFELTDTNFTGRAKSLSLQLRGAANARRAQVLLREPRTLGSQVETLASARYERRKEVSFEREDRSLRLDLWLPPTHSGRTRAVLRYALTDTRLHDLKITSLEAGAESIRVSGFTVALVHDRRDDILDPQHGFLLSADLNAAASWIGSEASFLKLTLKGYAYQRLHPRLVWASAVQLGFGLPRDERDSLPLSERYFAGGSSTLRGFAFNQAGPRDPASDVPTGGDAVLVLNQELRYRLLSRIVLTAFADAGNVYAASGDLGLDSLRVSLGVGIRYRGPVVAGLDYARLLDRRGSEDAGLLHFSLGFAF